MIVEAYHQGTLVNPSIPEIARNRNIVQHQLLSLPRFEDLRSQGQKTAILPKNAYLYEACRLTALLYAVMVTFPIPRSNQVRETLLRNLKEILVSIGMREGRRELLEVRLWCLVLGGIASLGKEEMGWYVEQTRIVVRLLQLGSWKDFETILTTFAWLGCACNPGTVEFWIWTLMANERN